MWTVTRLLVLLSVVTLASQGHLPGSCVFEGRTVPDGGRMTKADPCHLCHCYGGRLECVWKHCGAPPPRCRTLETDNGCNKTVYLCPLPGDSTGADKINSSASPEETASPTALGPYFPALSSPPPAGGPPSFRFSLLPPPLPSLSSLSAPEGRESNSDDSEGSAPPGATYFSEFSSAPMNFSATLGRGEGPRSPRRLAVARGDSAEEARLSDRLHFSAQKPWAAGRPDDRTAERTTQRTTGRTTEGTRRRPSFRISRPRSSRPTARSAARTAPRTVPWLSAEALARTTPKTSLRTTTRATTRTTPRATTWTTSPTTVHDLPQFPTRSPARPYSKPRLRFAKRTNSLFADRERTQPDREEQTQTTTRPPVRKSAFDLTRITQHPIVRPHIRPLSLAEPSKVVRTTARPEKISTPVTKPRRLTPRPGRGQQKTLSTTRHRLQRLFPSTVRPETDNDFTNRRYQDPIPTTVKPKTTTFASARRRARPVPAFQPNFPSSPIPRPRSRSRPLSSRSRPAHSSISIPGVDEPVSFPSFEEASSAAFGSEDSSSPLEREPTLPSAPAAVPLAAPVVSFDYDLEDDTIDLSEFEFPEFGRRLRREASGRKLKVSSEGIRGATKNSKLKARGGTRVEGGSREDRSRRSLLPGDERHGKGHHGHGHGHHGHHDQQHLHHSEEHDRHDPEHRQSNHRSHHSDGRHTRHQLDSRRGHEALPGRNRLGGYQGIGAKKFEGVLHRASHRLEESPSASHRLEESPSASHRLQEGGEDHGSHQLVDLDQDEPSTCFVSGTRFQLGEVIEAASDSCLECRCAGTAMFCYPKCCFYSTEEPRAGQAAHVSL